MSAKTTKVESTKSTKTAPKAKAKKANPKAKKPAKKSLLAKTKTGLRKPQIRILQCLAKSRKALSRKEIAEKAPVDVAGCVEWIGSSDPETRASNDAKHFDSLITLRAVKFSLPVEGNGEAYEITSLGRKMLDKI